MQELMKDGRKNMHEIDSGLSRAEKLVEDTVEIGKNVSGRNLSNRNFSFAHAAATCCCYLFEQTFTMVMCSPSTVNLTATWLCLLGFCQ
jgi:hypothetical protein